MKVGGAGRAGRTWASIGLCRGRGGRDGKGEKGEKGEKGGTHWNLS